MQVLISPLIAVSITNQADLIKKLIEKKGYTVKYQKTISVWDTKSDKNKAFLWFTLANIRFLGDAVPTYIMCKKPKAVYVTIEGIPTKASTRYSNLPKLEFIANSEFVKGCLQQANLKVVDVVHHAVDWEKCQRLREDSKEIRSKWESEFKGRVKLIYVGRNDPRKGLDRLAKAMGMVNEQIKEEVVLLLFTEGDLPDLEAMPNVLRIGTVNSMHYDQVLRMTGAADYSIFPSICEGFGMPVLEANAMGIPSIHCWFPPLSEFSSKAFNFVFGYQHETMVNQGHLQYWIWHEYRPELLAEMIVQAVRLFKDSRQEYDEFCAQATEHSKAWDYRKKYPKILKHLRI